MKGGTLLMPHAAYLTIFFLSRRSFFGGVFVTEIRRIGELGFFHFLIHFPVLLCILLHPGIILLDLLVELTGISPFLFLFPFGFCLGIIIGSSPVIFQVLLILPIPFYRLGFQGATEQERQKNCRNPVFFHTPNLYN